MKGSWLDAKTYDESYTAFQVILTTIGFETKSCIASDKESREFQQE